jgi:type II secretory pathway component PulK
MKARERGSVLVIVLWIAFGLVSLALYFADSMSYEQRAADNRVSALQANAAIEGAARYLASCLSQTQTNGVMPALNTYSNCAVPVGDAHFWIIGRDTNNPVGPGQLCFGLVDEASKLNLNSATSNQLNWLPNITTDLIMGILDWRGTNGPNTTETYYEMLQPAYQCKNAPFESVDELRLVYGANMDLLVGEDANRNGILDPNENDANQNGMLDPGLVEYVTAYSREPNTNTSGAYVNIRTLSSTTDGPLRSLLTTNFGTARANEILRSLGLTTTAAATTSSRTGSGAMAAATGRTGTGTATTAATAAAGTVTFTSPLQFFVRSGMTSSEFGQIFTNITVSTNRYIVGRVNVNTASATVLGCLLNGDLTAGQLLVNYRASNPTALTSIAWVITALGQSYASDLEALEAGDYITTQSYQFTADVAALGPHGRGYRRAKFIFDTSSGTPQIIYRQDLTHLGWALGTDVRHDWLVAKTTP